MNIYSLRENLLFDVTIIVPSHLKNRPINIITTDFTSIPVSTLLKITEAPMVPNKNG